MVCLALGLVDLWVVLGFSVGMEAFDELLLINILILIINNLIINLIINN